MHILRWRSLPIWIALVAGLIAGCGRSGPKSEADNLVLIMVDTLRPDHLGCYGYGPIRTPMIDGLARHGTLFERAVTPVPVTAPSFSSLLTSTYPPTHGVRDNGLYTLSEEMLTLAEVLRQNGFRTAAFLGSAVLDSVYGLAQGFSTYDDHFEGLYVPRNPEYLPLAEETRHTQRRAEIVTRNALRWIKANKRGRFFVMLHYFDPHAFYDPPSPFDSLYAGNPYDGEIAYTDSQIDVLVRGIGTFKIPGRTLVVVAADHGEGLMEHNESQHGLLIYDSTLRVPLIFNCPGICPQGSRVPDQVSLVDVSPTILAVLGIKAPGQFQGVDLSPFFEGRRPHGLGEVYCETFRGRLSYGWSELVGIRTDAWKLIRAPRSELYDLTNDPGERVNLYGKGLPMEAELERKLGRLLDAFPESERYRAREAPRDDVTRQRLESLGYLAGMSSAPPEQEESLPDPKDEMDGFNRRQLAGHYTRIGSSFLANGRFPEAIAALRRAVETEPESPLRRANLGTAYAREGNMGEAAAAFREALRINPNFAAAHLGLARLHETQGDTAAALESYRAALGASPPPEEAVEAVVRIETEKGRPEAAAALLETLLERQPDNAVLLSNLIQALRRAGRDEDSVPYLRRLAALQPLNPDPPFYLAHTLAHMGDEEGALSWYRRTTELNPGASDAYYNIACIYAKQGRKDEALEWLRKALDHGFTDPSYMRSDPDLESLRDDPRFRALF